MQLDEQTRLINERGMVLIGNEDEDEDFEKTTEEEQEKRTRAIVSSDTAAILSGLGSGPLDVRIKKLAEERDDLQDTVRRLKMDLEEEKNRYVHRFTHIHTFLEILGVQHRSVPFESAKKHRKRILFVNT